MQAASAVFVTLWSMLAGELCLADDKADVDLKKKVEACIAAARIADAVVHTSSGLAKRRDLIVCNGLPAWQLLVEVMFRNSVPSKGEFILFGGPDEHAAQCVQNKAASKDDRTICAFDLGDGASEDKVRQLEALKEGTLGLDTLPLGEGFKIRSAPSLTEALKGCIASARVEKIRNELTDGKTEHFVMGCRRPEAATLNRTLINEVQPQIEERSIGPGEVSKNLYFGGNRRQTAQCIELSTGSSWCWFHLTAKTPAGADSILALFKSGELGLSVLPIDTRIKEILDDR